MKIISEAYWACGARSCNQDSLLFEQVLTGKGRMAIAVISDGIGGLKEGEVASGYIVERIADNFYTSLIPLAVKGRGKRALKRSLFRCFWNINQELTHYAGNRNIRLGATVSLILFWKRRYLLFHLGDSRIYRCGRRGLCQLTLDHAGVSLKGRGVTKCMGSFPFQFPQIKCGRIYGKKGFLLCTDGYFRTMDKENAARVFAPWNIDSREQLEKRLRTMGERAVKKGEKDNLSALYVLAG